MRRFQIGIVFLMMGVVFFAQSTEAINVEQSIGGDRVSQPSSA